MKNLKAHQREQLIYELGLLLQPLESLVRAACPPTVGEYRLAVAKVRAGDGAWRNRVRAFTTFAPDIFLLDEFQSIAHVPERLLGALAAPINSPGADANREELQKEVGRLLSNALASFKELLSHVPVDWEPVVFEANTSFTSYLRIKECLAVVNHRLDYFDRYLKPQFFELFLAPIGTTVAIRLVTTAGDSTYGVAAVRAVASLARQQFKDFQLVEVSPSALHDRNLRVDDQVFTLGPGVDRAGIALTNFGPADSSPAAHRELDRIITGGMVIP